LPRPDWIDDPSIPAAAALWRGIVPDQIKLDDVGVERPQSGALVTHELSVSVAAETTFQEMMRRAPPAGWRLWEFTAGAARAAGCMVDRDPLEDDPSHAVVLNPAGPGQKRLTGGQATRLQRNGRWADMPPTRDP
jgi:hypothetical protein